MSPELRYVAALNRLARAISQAAARGIELGVLTEAGADLLQIAGWEAEESARSVLRLLAIKESPLPPQ